MVLMKLDKVKEKRTQIKQGHLTLIKDREDENKEKFDEIR